MDNYYSVFQSRINHLGESTAERIRNGGIRSFNKWMAESPHTVRNLSVERGIYFDGIILTNKDKEYEKIMFLNVANDIPLKVGDIMNWTLDDRSIEKWIIVQEEKKVNGTYRTFWIIRCNYLLKWIDNDGHLLQSWAYVVSSVDSKIKGNYRTWNALITPQPNKYAEILMPYYPIDRATNFIVQDESWHTIECDFTSVPGTIYISLTENKVNLIYDDLDNDIADVDKRAIYQVVTPPIVEKFTIGSPINPTLTIIKNGQPLVLDNLNYELRSKNNAIAKVINGTLMAISEGEAEIYIYFPDLPETEEQKNSLTFTIKVSAEDQTISYYIEGPDKIRLNRKATYTIMPNGPTEKDEMDNDVPAPIIWTVEDIPLEENEKMTFYPALDLIDNKYEKRQDRTTDEEVFIQCFKESSKTIEIEANDKNKLYKFMLIASVDNTVLATKKIQIIPIW